MHAGYLALIFHAHLPYVHHPDTENVLEERWLFEALTECYLPLLETLENLHRDGLTYQITISLSPPLLTMLSSPLLKKRYIAFLDNLVELAEKEVLRTKNDPEFAHLAILYRDKFAAFRHQFVHIYQQDLIAAFRRLQEAGCLELITCAGTHGFLPLMLTDEAVRAQIGAAVSLYKDYFGQLPKGIWLPECAYRPGLDQTLKEFGLNYFVVDTHGVEQGTPKPPAGVYNPLSTLHGVGVFGRDPESAHQVWSSFTGYPGDYDYREYYRDIGWDLPQEILKPYMHPDGFRHNTGIKYYRVTGDGEHREPYNPEWASEKAASHAGHFVGSRIQQINRLSQTIHQPPIVVCPYDAELFGHWWYEGPKWLEYVIRKSVCDQSCYRLISPSTYLAAYGPGPKTSLSLSTWGEGGYNKVWLNPANAWIYRHLHKAEERMQQLLTTLPEPSPFEERGLRQAGRELLLAQSSDWSFIMKTETTVDYAVKRFKLHISRFNYLYDHLRNKTLPEPELALLEQRDAIFPALDFRLWVKKSSPALLKDHSRARRRILMLSWEYPPKTVGGLARHVYFLAKALAQIGEEVHILTSAVIGYPSREILDGVTVHRLETLDSEGQDFLGWVFQFNLAIVNYAGTLIESEGPFALIHAHDWLVAYAAEALKKIHRLPLIATIHATEKGRNQGLYTDLQKQINGVEWKLTYEAWKVVCCSQYMSKQLINDFQLPADKVTVIPNGIDPATLRSDDPHAGQGPVKRRPGEKLIFFVGRLVAEKGVQVLIEALSRLVGRDVNVRCIIAGTGPMEGDLRFKAHNLGVEDRVTFLGFISDNTRNQLLSSADVAVFPSLYEPFGIVALEAMAAKTPVIVSDTGGLAEIVDHGVTGLKVSPGNAEDLAAAIYALLTDPDLAYNLAAHAWKEVETVYPWEAIARQTIKVYNQI